jgi:hypothetical protein
MSYLGKEEEHSPRPPYSAHSQISLGTDWQEREEAPGSPWQGPTMNFDLTPIFLDSDEEVDTEELRPLGCRSGPGWHQVSAREITLVLGHSGLYARRCTQHKELDS